MMAEEILMEIGANLFYNERDDKYVDSERYEEILSGILEFVSDNEELKFSETGKVEDESVRYFLEKDAFIYSFLSVWLGNVEEENIREVAEVLEGEMDEVRRDAYESAVEVMRRIEALELAIGRDLVLEIISYVMNSMLAGLSMVKGSDDENMYM